jgi:polysaccharide export outer membrane protein
MTNKFIKRVIDGGSGFVRQLKRLAPGLVMLVLVAGCQTQSSLPQGPPKGPFTEIMTLQAGDVVKISFAANPDLNTTQPVRRDGMISLPLIGEVKAAGKTPKQLEAELVKLYSTQLLSNAVTVELQSSTFSVYVSGSVLRSGKIVSDRPITALEAIMEAGGPDYEKANLKRVVVVRQEGDRSRKFTLNLKLVMDGKGGEPFYLRAGDTIYVPEKFTWF